MKNPIANIKKYVRATNYLSAAQIFLQGNYLVERDLNFDDIKPRLLGHWGSCPGINFTYANLNWLIKKHDLNMMFVLGPGHGFPAIQANLFLEGTLSKYYPHATQTLDGIGYLCKNFSWPYGFPSHSNPGTPGVILEGGELGYSLSTSYGAALDNPDLIVSCLVGDGEAETGPTATAWHLNKFLSPKTDGAVLPILHLNGYKISGPTITGRMSNTELKSLFFGYGYEPIIVEGSDIYTKMNNALEKSLKKIKAIQKRARSSAKHITPHWPMIVLRTPKGWTGIKTLKGKKIEGNCYAHQVVAKQAKSEKQELLAVNEWLKSYKFEELFNKDTGFIDEIKSIIPKPSHTMGSNKHTFGGKPVYKPLNLPSLTQFAEDSTVPGTIGSSSMRRAGEYLNEVFKLNKLHDNFRFFSPDETYSNKLDKIYSSTKRAFQWPLKPWDEDLAPEGKSIEMLSEHSLQGLLQGYVLTGRHGIFASYEAFIQIVGSMADQYAKFLHSARTIPWRGIIPSLNYILTSSGWRQEHNGFSHQNPGFIDDMLQRQGNFTTVYFPPDANSTLAVLEKCLSSTKSINVIAAGKTLEPRWLTPDAAKAQLQNEGIGIWDFATDENPDIVVCGIGDYLTKEALAAMDLVRKETSKVKMRFVNIMSLSSKGLGSANCAINQKTFEDYFTANKHVIVNFHGYPQTIKQILFDYAPTHRFTIHGYIESGSTTTPLDMQIRNKTSRYNLVIDIAEKAHEQGVLTDEERDIIISKYEEKLSNHFAYIQRHSIDPKDVDAWIWPGAKRLVEEE